MILIKNIEKKYLMGDHTVLALRNLSLEVQSGDFLAIMGPSGSGKSTLMHILGFLDVPDQGDYIFNNFNVSKMREDELAVLRSSCMGFVFQQFNLLARMTALENVALPHLYRKHILDLKVARNLLTMVNLGDRWQHRPNQLSGGQQQRVAIARALANQPLVILADEPTGNLDSASEKEILQLLHSLHSQGITVIIVTHEENIARQASRLIRMRDGEIASDERLKPLQCPSSLNQGTSPLFQLPSATLRESFQEMVEYFHQGYRTLMANKVRTFLSMLGVTIGVAAVVAMLAIGKGAQNAIQQQLANLGSNLLVLRPGAVSRGRVQLETGATTRLTLEDAVAIRDKLPLLKYVSPNVNGRGQVTFLNRNWSTQILGATYLYTKMRAAEPPVGRFFSDEDNFKRNRVAVIGPTLVRELFQEQSPIGEFIKINKVNFQVIGVLPERGSNGYRDQDDMIVIPILTAMHRLLGKEYIDHMDIEVRNAEDLETAQSEILNLLLTRHKISMSQNSEAFQVRNLADIQSALSESNRSMGILLASIAAISLLVGGIGIMNIMLVSVIERTREIGLRKALGARRWNILSQFLAEAVAVSALGGLFGIIFAWLITEILSNLAGWATSISMASISLAVVFSAVIGIVFGMYPAKKAAALHPIEALRFE